jgi:adenylate cyclase
MIANQQPLSLNSFAYIVVGADMDQTGDTLLRPKALNPSVQTPAGPQLTIEGPDGIEQIALAEQICWRMGRGIESAIVLKDELVSRNHAMIQRMDSGEFYLIDMGSRNGSFVNDRRVSTPICLRDGDRLKIGHADIVFRNPLALAPAAPQPQNDCDATICHLRVCTVSVLVIDIRGFTELSQQVDNAVLCQLMGSWFGEADRIMRSHGSATEKYIGDAVMAVWVHNKKGEEHAEILDIVRALSDFVAATETLGARFGIPGGLQIKAGLNTGSATVCNTGTSEVTDYTARGECVNAAFRLESATKTLGSDLCLGKLTSDFLRTWPAAAAYLKETQVELKGYAASVRTCPASFGDLKEFLESLDMIERRNPRMKATTAGISAAASPAKAAAASCAP